MLSSNFNPIVALKSTSQHIQQSNPWMMTTGASDSMMVLDNVEKFVTYLPVGDPLKRRNNPRDMLLSQLHSKKRDLSSTTTTATAGVDDTTTKIRQQQQQQKKKKKGEIHPLDTIMEQYSNTNQQQQQPMSVLYKLQKKRIRILVRYVNAIRGTLTGTLIAFDKHMNMILRDVIEIYSPRPIDIRKEKSNIDLELHRRQQINDDTTEVVTETTTEDGVNGDDDDNDDEKGNGPTT